MEALGRSPASSRDGAGRLLPGARRRRGHAARPRRLGAQPPRRLRRGPSQRARPRRWRPSSPGAAADRRRRGWRRSRSAPMPPTGLEPRLPEWSDDAGELPLRRARHPRRLARSRSSTRRRASCSGSTRSRTAWSSSSPPRPGWTSSSSSPARRRAALPTPGPRPRHHPARPHLGLPGRTGARRSTRTSSARRRSTSASWTTSGRCSATAGSRSGSSARPAPAPPVPEGRQPSIADA